jgi:hypothetical protein
MSAEAAGPLRTRREHAAVISAALVKGVSLRASRATRSFPNFPMGKRSRPIGRCFMR